MFGFAIAMGEGEGEGEREGEVESESESEGDKASRQKGLVRLEEPLNAGAVMVKSRRIEKAGV